MGDSNFEFTENVEKVKGKLRRQRNLRQYRDLSEEEFNETIMKKALGIEPSKAFEERIANKWAEFENDYDLSDLKMMV